MPQELWTEIFMCEHDSFTPELGSEAMWVPNLDEFGAIRYPTHRGPLYLPMRVCRKMRSAALSSPGLWNIIVISLDEKWLLRSSEESLKQWLDKSSNAPLHILLDRDEPCWRDRNPKEEEAKMRKLKFLINLLEQHSHRWMSLRINLVEKQGEHLPIQVLSCPSGRDD